MLKASGAIKRETSTLVKSRAVCYQDGPHNLTVWLKGTRDHAQVPWQAIYEMSQTAPGQRIQARKGGKTLSEEARLRAVIQQIKDIVQHTEFGAEGDALRAILRTAEEA